MKMRLKSWESRVKMKFLLDESLTYKNRILVFLPFFNSVDILGMGAPDEEIFKYAKKNNMIVVTKDKRFALDMIISGSKVVIVTDTYKTVLINPKIDVNPKYSSPMTYYLQKHKEIVIP